MSADRPAVPYRILVVCTGNICRSPFTGALLNASLSRIAASTGDVGWVDEIEVSSAGTVAMVGQPIEPMMASLLDHYGAVATAHAAHQLQRNDVVRADLVLGLARDHRRDVVTIVPSASRRVFALNEFARLLEDAVEAGVFTVDPASTARSSIEAIVEAAAMRRGFAIAPDDPGDDDVFDPYGRDQSAYEASAARIAEIVDLIERSVLMATVAPR